MANMSDAGTSQDTVFSGRAVRMKNITNEPITSQDVVFSVLYSFIVLAGVAANITVLVIVRRTPAMHTVTNFLLANLAIADLLTLLFCPGMYDFALKGVHMEQLLGDIVCKIFAGNAIVSVAINASVVTLCTVAIERYLALAKPLRTNMRLKKKHTKYAIGLIWAIALLSNVWDIKLNNYVKDNNQVYPCNRPWTVDVHPGAIRYYIILVCIFVLVVPVLVIFFCYWQILRGIYCTHTICAARQEEKDRLDKIKLCKLLVTLATVLAICCLPFAIFFLFVAFSPQPKFKTLHIIVHRSLRLLLFSNSFFNPFLYAMQSTNYRENFRRIFLKTQSRERQGGEIQMNCRPRLHKL